MCPVFLFYCVKRTCDMRRKNPKIANRPRESENLGRHASNPSLALRDRSRELRSAVPTIGTTRACDDCSRERRDFFDCFTCREHTKRVHASAKNVQPKKNHFVEMRCIDLRALVPDSSSFAQQLIQRHVIVQPYSRSFLDAVFVALLCVLAW